MPEAPSRLPLLVLAGGQSRRMGRDKAGLPWDGVPLLLRVLDRLAPIASEVWVAARSGQELPAGAYRRIDDRRPDEGPLAGLAAGLAAIGGATFVAVAACDYPHADPALFPALLAVRPDAPIVLPVHEGRGHPLMAVWRSDLAEPCERALLGGARRVRAVLDAAGAVEIDARLLPRIDPDRALLNVNDRESLERALRT